MNNRRQQVDKPRPMSLVRFTFGNIPLEDRKHYFPFFEGESCIFLGEIVNIPRHCVVIRISDGKTYSGYHTSSFIELTEEEV